MNVEIRSSRIRGRRRIRSYSAEMAIQRRRQRFRESRVEFEHGGVNWFDSRLRRRVFEGEKCCLIVWWLLINSSWPNGRVGGNDVEILRRANTTPRSPIQSGGVRSWRKSKLQLR